MRKLVWFGAAVMVAGAVAVYLAATYAVRHPDSYLGRCAAAAVYVGARCNPVTVATEVARGDDAECPGQVAGAMVGACVGAVQCEQAQVAKPVAACEPDAAEAAEPVEPIRPEALPQEPVAAPAEGECIFGDGMVPFTLPVVPMQTEEPMSGTEDALNTTGITLVEEPVCEAIPAPVEEAVECNEITYELEVCPCDGDKPCVMGCCAEGCCCWLKQLMKIAGLVQDMAVEAVAEVAPEEYETLPMPAECDDDEPQAEGVEGQENTAVPSCPTPSYYHDHGGCPYMGGGCPYMGGACPYYRGTPVVTPVEPARKVRVKKKSKMTLAKPLSFEMVWKKMFGTSYDEETPEWTKIDTMEFRPSDDPREPPGRSPF
jgi:hypothetical protein